MKQSSSIIKTFLLTLLATAWFWTAAAAPLTAQDADADVLTDTERAAAAQINEVSRRAAEKVKPAVVSIIVDAKRMGGSVGSGCIVDPAGYVITNNHVVSQGDQIMVKVADGREFKAVWVRYDPDTDLALIHIEPGEKSLPHAQLGDSDKVQVGDSVMAIGSPFGELSQTVTRGVVSFLGRQQLVNDSWAYEDFIQTDAVINKGNSGGPLVSLYGEVIGINSSILSPDGTFVGYSFAIPSNMARFVVEQLKEHENVKRGYLGVQMQPRSLDELRRMSPQEVAGRFGIVAVQMIQSLPEDVQGVIVTFVRPGMPAQKAGMRELDIITHFNEKSMVSSKDLRLELARMAPGTDVTCKVWRAGETLDLAVTLGDRATSKAIVKKNEAAEMAAREGKLGIRVQPLNAARAVEYGYNASVKGLLIRDVAAGSPAGLSGLRPGDVIVGIDGRAVMTMARLKEAVAAADFGREGLRLRLRNLDGYREVNVTALGR